MDKELDVLAFGAHPDDVELMCGGTIVKLVELGYRVGIVSLTAGEMGTRGSSEIRAKEFAESARIMRIAMHKSLDLPDGDLQVNKEFKLKIITEIRTFHPKLVFAPYWKTRHPDHSNCSHLVYDSVFLAGLNKIVTGHEAFRPVKLVFYMEHYEFKPSFIVDVSSTFATRLEAIQAYKSQVFGTHLIGNDVDATYISSQQYFHSITYKSQYWGAKIGVKFGEPFLVREPMKVNDPFALFI